MTLGGSAILLGDGIFGLEATSVTSLSISMAEPAR